MDSINNLLTSNGITPVAPTVPDLRSPELVKIFDTAASTVTIPTTYVHTGGNTSSIQKSLSSALNAPSNVFSNLDAKTTQAVASAINSGKPIDTTKVTLTGAGNAYVTAYNALLKK
jgi:Na+-translocating ferredoxin:NAD+ oxidoreductase RnfC subunit